MNRRAVILSLLSFTLLGFTVLFTACNQTDFAGSRHTTPDSYRLDIERMTGTDWLTLDLNAEDTLGVQFETVKGSMYMEIKAPDGTVLYAGNGKGTTGFTVNVPESGVYSVHVEAQPAKGTIHIQPKEKTK